jgi:competence protein ComEA
MAQSNASKRKSAKPDTKKLALVAACLFLAAACAGGVFLLNGSRQVVIETDSDTTAETVETANDTTVETVTVHVDGAVADPGVYEIAGDSPRVNDAVEAAGGLTEEADLASVNLAALVTDGTKIHVPLYGETDATADASGASMSSASGLINLNTATLDELCELNGVGEATAQAIIDEREANGPFASVEDLLRVSGIGEKKLAKIKAYVCV